MRSTWKGAFVSPSLYTYFFNSKKVRNKNILVCSRNTTILSCMVGKTVSIYNGLKFMPLVIKNTMIGYKTGSFVFTKKTGNKIHVNKNKKINRK